MRYLFVILSIVCMHALAYTQSPSASDCCETKPYIEVTGSAEMELNPDEIFITAVLQERYEGKEKVTLEKMETEMFAALKNIGVDSKNISLADDGNNFVYRKRKTDDALLSRSYTIQVATAAMVIQVFDALGKLDVYDAYISKTSHSKIETFRMQTKVNAAVAAKEKATQMLTAIGSQLGKPMLLQEINNAYYPQYEYSQISNASVAIMEYDGRGVRDEFVRDLSYQKIKIRYEVFARFEILSSTDR